MTRRLLDQRRYSETFDVEFPRGTGRRLSVSVGYYADFTIGEVFIAVDKKSGSDGDIHGQEIAVSISLGLQHGASLETQYHAAPKDQTGKPQGLAGIVLGHMIDWQKQKLQELK